MIFSTIHARLVASGYGARVGYLPVLPPKRSFSTQSEKFAERRRSELEIYLITLVTEPELRCCPELASFLELGVILRPISPHRSAQESPVARTG